MSGVEIKAAGESKALGKLAVDLKRLSKQGRAELINELGKEAVELVQDGFSTGTSPDGAAWKPLKVRAGQPLRDNDNLMGSVNFTPGGSSFDIGAGVWYGVVHQSGMKITVKTKKALASKTMLFGKSVVIPARPWLPTNDLPAKWRSAFDEVTKTYLELVLSG